MKRYETMSKEEIIDFTTNCYGRDCEECPAITDVYHMILTARNDCMRQYLNQKIRMVPRWQTAKTQEDMKKLFLDFRDRCINKPCATCHFEKGKSNVTDFRAAGSACFLAYLLEQIEAPEVEEDG